MSDFWAALGVLVPITSGLALLAYNKPRQYERLMNFLLAVISIIFVSYLVYAIAYTNGASDAFAHIHEKSDPVGFSYSPVFNNPFIPMAAMGFLMIALPGVLQVTRWIKAADDEKPDAGDKNP